MKTYGFDGQDQIFIGCPRYSDSPQHLVEKLRLKAMKDVKDPSLTAKEKVQERCAVMFKQEDEVKREVAERSTFWNKGSLQKMLIKIQQRNLILDHMMMIRNAPKPHMTKLVGAIRNKALKIEKKMIAEGRLEEKGNVFRLNSEEIDQATLSGGASVDLMKIIGPRKAVYKRALGANQNVAYWISKEVYV